MRVIDVSTMNDDEQLVCVIGGLTPIFCGPISEARTRCPEAFSDSPGESSPEAAQMPCGSVLAMAHAFASESAP